MGLEEIESEIRNHAKRQVEEINSKAKSEMDKIRQASESEAEEKCSKIRMDYARKSTAVAGSILSNARLQAEDLISKEKTKVLDETFKTARGAVLNLPAGEKKKLIAKMLEDKDLIDGNVIILAGKECAGMIPKMKDVEVKVQDIGEFGIVIKSKDGSIVMDKRLSEVFSILSEKIKPELCEILFKENEK